MLMVTSLTRPFSAFCAALSLVLATGAGSYAYAPPPEEDESEQEGRSLTGAASYMRFPPLQTALQENRRTRGMLQVRLALDAPQRSTRRLIEDREMWLRDAYAETLLLYGARMYRWGQVPDADMIADLLQQDTDRLLGEGRAQVVLDTVVVHAS